MRRLCENRVIVLTVFFFISFLVISCSYFKIAWEQEYTDVAFERSLVTIDAGDSQGTIYDRNMNRLVNRDSEYVAVVVPKYESFERLAEYAVDRTDFEKSFNSGEPFAFRCREKLEESAGLTVFEIPVRYSQNQMAQHILGYISDGEGVSGIEYAYNSVLRGGDMENSVTYSTDGFGNILIGGEKSVVRSIADKTGVVLTIDSEIQEICEKAGESLEKGAIVVSDVKNGDILAMVSEPSYSWNKLEKAVSDERSPLINRCLYAYGVGSVFKLVGACQAVENDYEKYIYKCRGSIDVQGQEFRCHKLDGHGSQNLCDAIVNSCNTYFISLTESFDVKKFRQLAFDFGFGREIHLCSGMTSSAGVLPTVRELMIPAELANFSFGQGKLTATPLQVNQFTCTIAGGGEMPILRLIKGITVDGESVSDEKLPQKSRVIKEEISEKIRSMMISAVYKNPDSNAKPCNVIAGAKTSTAQTGRFDENGVEYCHGWITGFFPAYEPKYAVTVLAEDGGYGNDVCAPVFREITEQIKYRIIDRN